MRRRAAVVATVLVAAACAADPAPQVRPTPSPSLSPSVTRTPAPQPPLRWGPTREQYSRAAEIVSGMSVEQQAGQVIVTQYGSVEAAASLIQELHLGGVIVMDANVTSQLGDDIAALQAAAARAYPLVVGVDQEGGTVARIGRPATEFPALMTLGAARDPWLAHRVARASGQELRALGFTMVFAPDADVTSGPDDPTIGSRSASSDARVAADIVGGAVRGYAQAGIVGVAKHFPGHGTVPADSHVELPVQDATLDELRAHDLVPFQAALRSHVPAVMLGHIDVRDVDPGVPSSTSAAVVGLLRKELGFDGLVVTDAQNMAAVVLSFGAGEAAVRSLAAGVDLVLMPADVRAAHAAIVSAVAAGTLPAARLSEAATRVVALMLWVQGEGARPPPSAVGSNAALSYEESLTGLTVVSGACGGRLVGDAVRVVGGVQTDRSRFTAAAEAAGLPVGSGDVVHLLGDDAPGSGDVVVALDTPYGLARSDAASARIALYGRTPEAFRALVDVLLGNAVGGGTLPVDVPGVDRTGCPRR